MGRVTVSEVGYTLYEFLKQSILFAGASKPTGITAFERLDNAVTEDVIIETLPMNYGDVFQTGILNVNIFVNNLVLKFAGGDVDRSQRNSVRLGELDSLLMNAFIDPNDGGDTVYFDNYSFSYEQSAIYADTPTTHYLNARIEYRRLSLKAPAIEITDPGNPVVLPLFYPLNYPIN